RAAGRRAVAGDGGEGGRGVRSVARDGRAAALRPLPEPAQRRRAGEHLRRDGRARQRLADALRGDALQGAPRGREEVNAPALALALALGGGDRTDAGGGADEGIHREAAVAVDGARDWLVAHQNPDGSFGSFKTERWFEVSATVPSAHEAFRFA